MVFQRSAILLLAASAALVSTDALSVGTQSSLMIKAVKPFHEHEIRQVNSPVVHHKKSSHKKQSKQVAVGVPKPVEKPTQKPVLKPVEKPQAEDEFEEDSGSGITGMHDMTLGEDEAGVESEDIALPVGGSVDVTFGGANITLKHFANGSVVMYANGKVTVLNGKDIYLDFDVEDEEVGSASGSSHGSGHAKAGEGKEVGSKEALVKAKKDAEGSSVLQKFSEFATKLTGDGFKESTPIILMGGAIGALAAVFGIAAVAARRARGNAAADDPQSMLADGTENAETSETTTKEEDAAADESEVLDSSDSESETETEKEEGEFMNEDTSV